MHNDQHMKRLRGEEAKALNELIQLCISQGINCTSDEKLAVVWTICLTDLLNTEEKLRAIDIVGRVSARTQTLTLLLMKSTKNCVRWVWTHYFRESKKWNVATALEKLTPIIPYQKLRSGMWRSSLALFIHASNAGDCTTRVDKLPTQGMDFLPTSVPHPWVK